jgi:hypothetical protein
VVLSNLLSYSNFQFYGFHSLYIYKDKKNPEIGQLQKKTKMQRIIIIWLSINVYSKANMTSHNGLYLQGEAYYQG